LQALSFFVLVVSVEQRHLDGSPH